MEDLSASLNVAQSLAVFLQDYGIYAFCSITLIGYAMKDRQLRQSEQEKFELALSVAPLAERLGAMLEAAARARRTRHTRTNDSTPPALQENIHG